MKMQPQTNFPQKDYTDFAVRMLKHIKPRVPTRQEFLTKYFQQEKIPLLEFKKPTYSQQWHEYNLGQTREKLTVMALLDELLFFFPLLKQPVIKKRGRPAFSIRDGIYCIIMKMYISLSSRIVESDLQLCKKAGYIENVPHFNTTLNLLADSQITKILTELITLSALPLKLVESQFAVDSTGFSTSCFERWYDIRLASNSMKRKFMKCHATIGTNTNVITSVEITEGHYGDSPEFSKLVHKTAKYFNVEEVSADKAYSSRENLSIVDKIGAVPFIPFKSNTRPNIKGVQIWRTMHDMFVKDHERFALSYHRRSNIETAFGMIKKKFGFHLLSRTREAQINEILCKCLCHNLAVLVHESFELGIEIDFNKCANEYLAQEVNN